MFWFSSWLVWFAIEVYVVGAFAWWAVIAYARYRLGGLSTQTELPSWAVALAWPWIAVKFLAPVVSGWWDRLRRAKSNFRKSLNEPD